MKENKNQDIAEFEIQELLPVGFMILVLVIGIAYGLQIMGDIKNDMTTDSIEYNATVQGQAAVAKIPEKMGIVVTIVMASVVLGVLITHLYKKIVG